jgi:hypothetical protein
LTPAPGTTVVVDAAPDRLADAIAVGDVAGPADGPGAAPGPAVLARPDTATVRPGQTVTIDPRANDAGGAGDALTVTALTEPIRGDVARTDDGAIRFTAPPGLTEAVRFSYRVADDAGGADAATVTAAVPGAQEPDGAPPGLTALSAEAQVTALYLGIFGRVPDPGGLAFWTDQVTRAAAMGVDAETILANVAESFRVSPEGRAHLPTLDSGAPPAGQVSAFVETLYATAYGRAPEPDAAAHWRDRIADEASDGAPLGGVLVDMLMPGVSADDDDQAALYHRIEVAQTAVARDAFGDGGADSVLADVAAERASVDAALVGTAGASGGVDDLMIG